MSVGEGGQWDNVPQTQTHTQTQHTTHNTQIDTTKKKKKEFSILLICVCLPGHHHKTACGQVTDNHGCVLCVYVRCDVNKRGRQDRTARRGRRGRAGQGGKEKNRRSRDKIESLFHPIPQSVFFDRQLSWSHTSRETHTDKTKKSKV